MLSAETAIGAHPVLAAEAAVRIASTCEAGGASRLPAGMSPAPGVAVGALAYAAASLVAADSSIDAIACYTRTGRTARMLSALRPGVPIIAFSPDPHVAGRLALAHGVFAQTCAPLEAPSDRLRALESLLQEAPFLPTGASVAFVTSAGDPGSAPDILAVRRLTGGGVAAWSGKEERAC
jgi:pyruvate kinase